MSKCEVMRDYRLLPGDCRVAVYLYTREGPDEPWRYTGCGGVFHPRTIILGAAGRHAQRLAQEASNGKA